MTNKFSADAKKTFCNANRFSFAANETFSTAHQLSLPQTRSSAPPRKPFPRPTNSASREGNPARPETRSCLPPAKRSSPWTMSPRQREDLVRHRKGFVEREDTCSRQQLSSRNAIANCKTSGPNFRLPFHGLPIRHGSFHCQRDRLPSIFKALRTCAMGLRSGPSSKMRMHPHF
jgi:hypothetical protein